MCSVKYLFLFVLAVSESIIRDECKDCVIYYQCPKALDMLVNNKTTENVKLLKSALCGFHDTSTSSLPKVCCSMISSGEEKTEKQEISKYSSIENHVNLKLLPEDCGVIKGDRIVGGEIADLYEFPWMALIGYNTRDGHRFMCGGSIINKRYILTAAHCVKNKNIAGVRVGEYDLNTDIDCQKDACENHTQDIRVEKQVIHDGYNTARKGLNDIALLRLVDEIDFNHRNVKQICLPTTSELRNKVLSNEIATVTGWGLTENWTYSPVLRKVDIPILPPENCSDIYERNSKAGTPISTKNQLCAGAEKKDSCKRDSGGPLMLEQKYNNIFRYVQYGLVSYGPAYCGSGKPGVYVDTTKFMDWILDNIYP